MSYEAWGAREELLKKCEFVPHDIVRSVSSGECRGCEIKSNGVEQTDSTSMSPFLANYGTIFQRVCIVVKGIYDNIDQFLRELSRMPDTMPSSKNHVAEIGDVPIQENVRRIPLM
jgi:hypothetical protein